MTLTQSFKLPADDIFQSVEHTLSADVWNAMHYSEEDILFFAQGIDENSTNQSAFICKSLEHRYLELFIVMMHAIYCVYEEVNEMRDTSTVHVTKKVKVLLLISITNGSVLSICGSVPKRRRMCRAGS